MPSRKTSASTSDRLRRRPKSSTRSGDLPGGEDGWVDVVADEVTSLLDEEGLQLELVVFYDPTTEVLHAVGYDGAPARYFRTKEEGALRALGPTSGPAAGSPSRGGPSGTSATRTGALPADPLPLTAMAGRPDDGARPSLDGSARGDLSAAEG